MVKTNYYVLHLKDVRERRKVRTTELRDEYKQSLKDFRTAKKKFFKIFNQLDDAAKLASAERFKYMDIPAPVPRKYMDDQDDQAG